MRKAPTKDTMSQARGDGPCLDAKDNMFTKALSVGSSEYPEDDVGKDTDKNHLYCQDY